MSSRGLPLPILRVPPPGKTRDQLLDAARCRLAAVLSEVKFPARRWQLLAASDSCGADVEIRLALQRLDKPDYVTAEAVVREVVLTHKVYLR